MKSALLLAMMFGMIATPTDEVEQAGYLQVEEFAPEPLFHTDGRGTPRLDFITQERMLHGLVILPIVPKNASPQIVAEAYLRLNRLRYGLTPELVELRFTRMRLSLLGYHCSFQETVAGRDVISGEIVVSMDTSRRVTMVSNNIYPLDDVGKIETGATLSPDAARSIALNDFAEEGAATPDPALKYLPEGLRLRLVYEARVTAGARSRSYLIDAASGEILRSEDPSETSGAS